MDKRLSKLADFVTAGHRLADIGTDHAYLPIDLVKNNKIPFAIASDIAKGPLENAKEDIFQAGLSDKIETRLGAGLDTISEQDKIETVVIAGMGGKLIVEILEAARKRGLLFKELVLGPNIGEINVRTWLMKHHYQIVDEALLAQSGHRYEIIKANYGVTEPLSPKELYFGPKILAEKNAVFFEKWQAQAKYLENLLDKLNMAKKPDSARITDIKQQLQMIQEELND
ncbi:MAG: class I SAM-dependent methyltransferase [Lactobacillus sp.]|nr:class I SAM-dependent methyltransferase [Lactobacillus sp.]